MLDVRCFQKGIGVGKGTIIRANAVLIQSAGENEIWAGIPAKLIGKDNKTDMGKIRDIEVDFLRSIGVLLIFLAHIKAPIIPTVIRCFDVPLMVFVSGLCYSGKTLRGQNFYSKRIFRLIIPTWLFLVVLFAIETIIFGPLDYIVILRSFLLFQNGSIGYVWIIKVFLLIMIVTPLLIRFVASFPRSMTYVVIFGLFVVEELLARGLNLVHDSSAAFVLIVETIPYLLGYSVFFILGLVTKSLSKKQELVQLMSFGLICAVVFSIWYSINGDLMINYYKYPPQQIYIAYGCVMPLLLWFSRRALQLQLRYERMGSIGRGIVNIFVFIGQNTLWIYLWHILFVLTANHFIGSWPVRYLFVLVMSMLVMMIQYSVVKIIRKKRNWPMLDYFVG